SEKITAAHKELKTYGIGKDLKRDEWQWMVQQLLYHKYMRKTDDQYGTLKLTDNGWKILKGEAKLMLVMKKEKEQVQEQEEVSYDAALMKDLKGIRQDIANYEHVPAYVIVSDASLVELASYLPQTFDELKQISGFGD